MRCRPRLLAHGQGRVSVMGHRTAEPVQDWSPSHHACLLSNTDTETLTHQQGTWPWGLGLAGSAGTLTAGGVLGQWVNSSISVHFLSPWGLLTSPRELPVIRVSQVGKKLGEQCPGHGHVSGSTGRAGEATDPKLQIWQKPASCWPYGQADPSSLLWGSSWPHPLPTVGTQEGTASLLIGSNGEGNYKAGPALLAVPPGG